MKTREKMARPRIKLGLLALVMALHLALPLLFRAPQIPPDWARNALPPPILVSLRPPDPPPVPSPEPEAQSSQGGSTAPETVLVPEPPPPPVRVRAARPTTQVEPLPVTPTPAPVRDTPPVIAAMPVLSAGQLSGALRAGSGAGSGAGGSGTGSGSGVGDGAGASCDMVARLQAALKDHAPIRAAIAAVPNSASGAVLVWDGDWIQSPGQAGRGLATVRQAIAVEVAFAPAVCRAGRVNGLALISLGDGPDAPKLVLGKGSWRWSDLVSTRR